MTKESALQSAKPAIEERWDDGRPGYCSGNGLDSEVEPNPNTLVPSSPLANSADSEMRILMELSHSQDERKENSAFDSQNFGRGDEELGEDEEIVDCGSSKPSEAATPTPHSVSY